MGKKTDKKKHQTRRQRQASGPDPQSTQTTQNIEEPSYLDLIPPPEFRGAFALTGLHAIAESIEEKRKSAKSLEDIEQLINFEFRFIETIREGLAFAPIAEHLQDPSFRKEYEQFQILDTDLQVVQQWRQRQAKIRNFLKDRIKEVEASLRPRPNFEILSTAQYQDNIAFSVSEEVPEFNFRLRQANAYFTQVCDTHCFYPEDNRTEALPFRNKTAPSFFVAPRTRIPSRKYILSPENSLEKEYIRYMVLFLTSVIKTNKTPEFLPYVPFLSDEPMPVVITIDGATAVAEFPTSMVD